MIRFVISIKVIAPIPIALPEMVEIFRKCGKKNTRYRTVASQGWYNLYKNNMILLNLTATTGTT